MKILPTKNLKPYNSFSLNEDADLIIEAESTQDLVYIWSCEEYSNLTKLPLGRGSNTLFCGAFPGVVILNRILGKQVIELDDSYLITVSSGEDWPDFVEWCVENNYYGVENLAMIPGCVGSSPIQNIGAYGVELKDVCDSVEYLDLTTLKLNTLKSEECFFGYRDSIFKQKLKDNVIITSVTLRLNKQWKPLLSYGPLACLDKIDTKAKDVYKKICEIRSKKLPDPNILGNAGSFFKNPIISNKQYTDLISLYPNMPAYSFGDAKKIAAGWLIDNAGLKGFNINGAGVHKEQALVLVNNGNATSSDVLELANYVKAKVFDMYQIELEHEVRFYFEAKETFLSELFNERSC
ncbi:MULTISPECIES: UDP-N-acetylmuramate dehydrogenase [unclassified Aliivibrio]|jgi:UDP-N-acetylmuramate dehydrogenase|uniref:UDP-N-acetylmuramate dehydrogenase n=1 Tax=unclassified Aliivibrio TaxID=2645654 RepID=UPI00080EC1D0|nr:MULTISPECIES: UDP-N-acetylmuramate dehydrogenase [unclassified Aliivibrio]OCH14581.1 UDP-N-acetylenolpyruvoylglucosamine reductase [Aliivibrio sp. 1S165]OCH24437.1 UDP-N-acetylenolpyruvoylglucosamine reductase [Aliivibrio sp. 1S128]OCH31078.1 UDP-N-acetylenolpyruvoylglucosamine reductase [Aliivibrio sp. 1S175]